MFLGWLIATCKKKIVVLSGMRLEVRIYFTLSAASVGDRSGVLLALVVRYLLSVNICCGEVWTCMYSDIALLEEEEVRRVAAWDGINGAQHSHSL